MRVTLLRVNVLAGVTLIFSRKQFSVMSRSRPLRSVDHREEHLAQPLGPRRSAHRPRIEFSAATINLRYDLRSGNPRECPPQPVAVRGLRRQRCQSSEGSQRLVTRLRPLISKS